MEILKIDMKNLKLGLLRAARKTLHHLGASCGTVQPSLKKIPIATPLYYLDQLIEGIECTMIRMNFRRYLCFRHDGMRDQVPESTQLTMKIGTQSTHFVR